MKDKEKLGIYNVTFNDKKATPVTLNPDIALVENAVIDTVVMYVKGYHLKRRDIGLGAKHIKIHLEEESEGYITVDELLNLGNSLRGYLKNFNEPFIDKDSKHPIASIYEWRNKENIGFRCVIDKASEGRAQPPRSPSNKIIITFYTDRNLNEKMVFKNPAVREFYESKKFEDVEDYSAVEEIKAEISKNSEEKTSVDANKNSKRRNDNGS